MYMSGESLLVILVIGAVAGWLAGKIVQGTGFGLLMDIVVCIVGAFIGNWLLPQLEIHLGVGIISAIISATIGAVILLIIVRLVNVEAAGSAALTLRLGQGSCIGARRGGAWTCLLVASADSEENKPATDIDTAVVNSLKVLDPERPIREADKRGCGWDVRGFAVVRI